MSAFEPNPAGRSPAEALREMIGGYRSTQLVYAAAKPGIGDPPADS